MFTQILDEIKKYDTIILHRHSKPDGDAMGSQIGFKHILKENFPEKTIYMVGDDARFFSFMEDSVMDEIPDSIYEGALAIVLDCGSSHLISDERYKLAEKTVRFDHHVFCEDICDIDCVETSYESCAGLIADFARQTGLTVNKLAAQSLYTGMLTDSGRFRYDSTSARTFELAAFLMKAEFDTNEIFRHLYADEYENKKLKAQFVLKIQFTEHNVAYIYTTKEEFEQYGVDSFTISRGMVGTMADMKGVDIWVNFTETDAGVLCELRSSRFNINPIAVKYGGGGHQKASGATIADHTTALAMLKDLDDIAKGE